MVTVEPGLSEEGFPFLFKLYENAALDNEENEVERSAIQARFKFYS